eukprot:scaffold34287_cov22-Tisochrysis_lutea.AAC.1
METAERRGKVMMAGRDEGNVGFPPWFWWTEWCPCNRLTLRTRELAVCMQLVGARCYQKELCSGCSALLRAGAGQGCGGCANPAQRHRRAVEVRVPHRTRHAPAREALWKIGPKVMHRSTTTRQHTVYSHTVHAQSAESKKSCTRQYEVVMQDVLLQGPGKLGWTGIQRAVHVVASMQMHLCPHAERKPPRQPAGVPPVQPCALRGHTPGPQAGIGERDDTIYSDKHVAFERVDH